MEGKTSSPGGAEDSVDFAISFEDISVFQRSDGNREKVISNATGCVHSGDVLALVGPSLQTSLLLDTLRGLHTSDTNHNGASVNGRLSWNGQSPEEVDPRALAFVAVKGGVELLSENLSCWEVLYFTIKARVAFLSTGEQSSMVDQVLDMLSLAEVADVPVKSLSELHKRCLCVAKEIVGCAGIVFLREPIEGLIAADAKQLLSILNSLATSYGYAVVATLPSIPWRTVGEVKNVLVLSEDGRVLYQGLASNAQVFFTLQGVDCKGESVADLLVHAVHDLPGSHQDALVVANADSDVSRASRRLAVDIRSGRVPLPPLVLRGRLPAMEPGDLRWLVAMLDLEWRVLRGDTVSVQRYIVAPLLLGLVLGVLFFRLPSDAIGEEERVGICFVVLVLFGIDAGLGMKALEGRMMWGEVCAGRLSLPVHALVTAYGELVLRRTAPAILLPLPLLLLSSLTTSFHRCLGFLVVCVVATWSCSALAIALWLLVTGLRETSSWGKANATALGAMAAAAVGVLALVAGFPLSPRDMAWHLSALRVLSPFALSLDAMANALMGKDEVEAAGFSVVSPAWHLLLLSLLSALYIALSLLPSLLAQHKNGAPTPAPDEGKRVDEEPYQAFPFFGKMTTAVTSKFGKQQHAPDPAQTPLNP